MPGGKKRRWILSASAYTAKDLDDLIDDYLVEVLEGLARCLAFDTYYYEREQCRSDRPPP